MQWGELLLGWGELVAWSHASDNLSDGLIVYQYEPFWGIATVAVKQCGPRSFGDPIDHSGSTTHRSAARPTPGITGELAGSMC